MGCAIHIESDGERHTYRDRWAKLVTLLKPHFCCRVIPTTTVKSVDGGIDGIISKAQGSMFSYYTATRLCIGQFQQATVVNVQQLVFPNSTFAVNSSKTSNGGSALRRSLTAGVTEDECTGLASLLNVPSTSRVNVSCTTIDVNGQVGKEKSGQ